MLKRVAGSVLVLYAALLLPSCGSSSSSPSMPSGTPSANMVITITGINGNMSFSPNPAVVKAGQTVAWHNSGGTTHTATSDSGAFDTGNIGNGDTSGPITMSTAGAFNYHCAIHGSLMTGTLTVTQ
jgi:plastocyanin